MPLSISSRAVGDVLVVKCAGRIIAGTEMETLHEHVKQGIAEIPDVVLVLEEVEFVDSSGLGMLVRLVGNARAAGGDVKICAPPQQMRNALRLTNLDRILEIHATEGDAIIASYQRRAPERSRSSSGVSVLCVNDSAAVLGYVTELLRGAGYGVVGARNLYDAKILARGASPSAVIIGGRLQPKDGASLAQWMAQVDASIPLLVLDEDFSTQEAGRAAELLLERVRAVTPSMKD